MKLSNPLRTIVTGDHGVDIYSRYIPGAASRFDEDVFPEVAYDLDVPCGAGLHFYGLKFLLGDGFEISFHPPSRATLRKTLQFVEPVTWGDATPIRITHAVPRRRPEPTLRPIKIPPIETAADCLLLHDATTTWRKSPKAQKVVESFFKYRRKLTSDAPPAWVIIGERLPHFVHTKQGYVVHVPSEHDTPEESPVWRELFEHSQDVGVICSSTALRHAGSNINRGLSFEKTIEDTLAEIRSFPALQALSQFRHLIIRYGFVGALHLERMSDGHHNAQFVFAPNARDGMFRDRVDDGRVNGRMSVIAATIFKTIHDLSGAPNPSGLSTLDSNHVANALRTGLYLGMKLFESGYPCPALEWYRDTNTDLGAKFLYQYFLCDKSKVLAKPPGNVSSAPDQSIGRAILSEGYDSQFSKGKIRRSCVFGVVTVPESFTSQIKSAAADWQMLRDAIDNAADATIPADGRNAKVRGEAFRVRVGLAICKYGHHEVLNRPLDVECLPSADFKIPRNELTQILSADGASPLSTAIPSLYFPILECGQLVAVERDEIESFRSIRNLMKAYLQAPLGSRIAKRPISIAVFGAPGTGKSFAVKQVAQSIGSKSQIRSLETIECNVSQFKTSKDLARVMMRIASLNNERKIPLVFFDEFDCSFEKQPLGWLKYFLSPMQDGTFYGAKQTITFGRAIFVFAGGVSRTIYEFDPYAEKLKPQVKEREPELGDVAICTVDQSLSSTPLTAAGRTSVWANLYNNPKRFEEFKNQKGPDFVSRLRGFVNIYSINQDEVGLIDVDGNPIKPVIRRAIILRSLILDGDWVVKRDGIRVSSIDNDVLRALLTVKEYRHGVRSMEAILQMCTPIDGIIEKASLPSRAQLEMHVDAKDFLERLQLCPSFPMSITPPTGESSTSTTQPLDSEDQQELSQIARFALTEPATWIVSSAKDSGTGERSQSGTISG